MEKLYIYRYPKYKNITGKDLFLIDAALFLDLTEAEMTKSEKLYKFKDEEMVDEYLSYEDYSHIDKDCLDFYKKHYDTKYWSWDVEHKYGHKMIMQQVADWRKANQIHNWFVENVQDGIDDCNYHREVTEDDLMELMSICQRVLRNSELVSDVNCERIKDSSVAEELLPTTSGFFFGDTGYTEYYLEDLKDTVDIIQKVLDTTDFDSEMIYYVSSW
jgi:hypothetical protein